jgi:2-dehydropantoate 2-reductase
MREDVRHRRPTEVDYLNGHVVGRGEEFGIPTPLNARLVTLVRQVESGAERQRPELLLDLPLLEQP